FSPKPSAAQEKYLTLTFCSRGGFPPRDCQGGPGFRAVSPARSKVVFTSSQTRTRQANRVARIAASPSGRSRVAQPHPPADGRRWLFPGADQLDDGRSRGKHQRAPPGILPDEEQGQAPEARGEDRGEAEAVRSPEVRQLPPSQ